jgi:hypothetical protein
LTSVDPKIWTSGRRSGRLKRITQRLWELIASLSLPMMIIAGPLVVFTTLLGTYYLVGPALLGPVLVLVWSLLVIGFVIVVEKRGYARNFDKWDFPLSRNRLLALPLAFGAVLTIIYIIIYFQKV